MASMSSMVVLLSICPLYRSQIMFAKDFLYSHCGQKSIHHEDHKRTRRDQKTIQLFIFRVFRGKNPCLVLRISSTEDGISVALLPVSPGSDIVITNNYLCAFSPGRRPAKGWSLCALWLIVLFTRPFRIWPWIWQKKQCHPKRGILFLLWQIDIPRSFRDIRLCRWV